MKQTPEQKAERARKEKIKKFLEEHSDEVVDTLLEQSPWHKGVDPSRVYRRQSDDTDGEDQGITVTFGPDGDAWFQVLSSTIDRETGKPQYDSGIHRFRTYFGGGRSLRVRTALIFLARAIQLDQGERPDR